VKVTVVAPHPDDESIGCGGAIAAHRAAGDHVAVVWLTSGEGGLRPLPVDEARAIREAEAHAAADVLGVTDRAFLRFPDGGLDHHVVAVAEELAGRLGHEEGELVYAPHAADGHADHMAAHAAVVQALATAPGEVPVCGYEVWTPLGHADFVWPIDEYIDRKLDAVRCHRSQLEHFRMDAAAKGLAAYRGALLGGCRFAEAFSCAPGVEG
jgi:LmbE family N-acetylglucosaminyl deacetylase